MSKIPMKYCSGCKSDLPHSEFNRAKKMKDGLQTACKKCRKAWDFAYRARKGPEFFSAAHRRRKWGITPEQYNDMPQGGKCAICPNHFTTEDDTPHVDHFHASGVIRGLLCSQCSLVLGATRDRPEILDSMKAYLLRFTL